MKTMPQSDTELSGRINLLNNSREAKKNKRTNKSLKMTLNMNSAHALLMLCSFTKAFAFHIPRGNIYVEAIKI